VEGVETNKIIKKYNNGFYWVDLEDTHCTEEGKLGGHCGSTGKGDTLFSLRKYDPNTNSREAFVTIAISPIKRKPAGKTKIEVKKTPHHTPVKDFKKIRYVTPSGTWYQAKGKKNSKPKKEYYPYIADILIQYNTFEFEPEYESGTDFTAQDFTKYIENNEDKYENADVILSQIAEQGIEGKADAIWDKYKDSFTKIIPHYDFDGDEDTYIHAFATVYVEVTKEQLPTLPYFIRFIEKYKKGESDETIPNLMPAYRLKAAIYKMKNDVIAVLRKTGEGFRIYPESDWAEQLGDIITFHEDDNQEVDWEFMDFESNPTISKIGISYYLSNRNEEYYSGEIANFENFLSYIAEVNKIVTKENFNTDFANLMADELEKIGIVPPEEERRNNSLPKPEDPRQTKFPFGESKSRGLPTFKKFVNL